MGKRQNTTTHTHTHTRTISYQKQEYSYIYLKLNGILFRLAIETDIIIIIIYYAFIRSIQGYKPIGYRTCHWIVHKEKYSG